MRITDIRINGIQSPIGFALDHVNCSFMVEDAKGKKVDRIRVEIAKDERMQEVLDAVEGVELYSVQLKPVLEPRTRYYVHIFVCSDLGEECRETAFFETGKMGEKWDAHWICADKEYHPVLTKKFQIRKDASRIRLYACGVGLMEAYLDGEKLGDEYLAPYLTNYECNLQVITYVIDSLDVGEHELSFHLAKGWYMGSFGLDGTDKNYGDRMAVIAELHIEYEDQSREMIGTDESFICTGSDIEESGIYYGEDIDRLLWSKQENVKEAARILNTDRDSGSRNLRKEHLCDRLSLPVRIQEILPVQKILTTPKGELVLDFGQNFAGLIEFDAEFPSGTVVTLDFGEILQEGNFYRDNYREARSKLVYTSDGRKETVRPRFTFFGFRYVRVSGWEGEIHKESFRGLALYSDMERTGYIHTGCAKLDRLYENTLWGLKSNFIDLPTDCPQRNERLGWTGDAQVFAPTASYHMQTEAFFAKYIRDLMDEQNFLQGAIPNYVPNIGHKPDATNVWGDIATFLPEVLYRYYGDEMSLRKFYPMMKNWVDYLDRLDSGREYLTAIGFQFGDWLALDGVSENSFKGSTEDQYIGSIYYCISAKKTADAAGILGYTEDEKKYRELEKKIRDAILAEYFTPNGRLAMDTQTGYILALYFDICRDKKVTLQQLKDRLKKDGFRLRCGFVGAPLLCSCLAKEGELPMAFDLLLSENYPSWLHCVNLGATTIWERWNSVGDDGIISSTGMNSLNHYAYGSVMEFMYAYVAGIRPLEPGFKKSVIAPNIDARLAKLEAKYRSKSGIYAVSYELEKDGRVGVDIEIPFSASARLILPYDAAGERELEAGKYHFEYMPTKDLRKPFDGQTPICKLIENEDAAAILMEYVPILAHMARESEFKTDSLEDFRFRSFLPIERARLEEAIERIKDVTI